MQRRLAILFHIAVICAIGMAPAFADPVHLESTYYYDGDFGHYSWMPTTIAVDSDGTVALAFNRDIGACNSPTTNGSGSLIFLYDPKGDPIGIIGGATSGMVDVAFGPDHRIYTAENWFGTGLHVYDRVGDTDRLVPKRFLRGDGGNVDSGGAASVACGPDFRLWDYNSRDKKVHVLSPNDQNLMTIDPPAGVDPRIKVAPDGAVFMSNWKLQPDSKTWAQVKYSVLYVRMDGKLLVKLPGGDLGRYDRTSDKVEAVYPLPQELWGDYALGPDNNVYVTPAAGRNDGRDAGLAYIVVAPGGKILMRRGSDFDRLSVDLPTVSLTAGADVPITAKTVSSRDLGYVPPSNILPGDNRASLDVKAWIAPEKTDPLADTTWTSVALSQSPGALPAGDGARTYRLTVPAGLFGKYRLRLTAGRVMAGYDSLQVGQLITVQPVNAAATLEPSTDRDRIGFQCGETIRVPVHATALSATDLTGTGIALINAAGESVWTAPLGLGTMAKGSEYTPVVAIPGSVTRLLPVGEYRASVVHAPVGAEAGFAAIDLVSPVAKSDFQSVMHPIGGARDEPADARFHASLGATRVIVTVEAGFASVPSYLDAATRLGLTVQYQPYNHFAALNTMPEEQGAMRHYFATTAQTLSPYPSFVGFNYHDLWSPFGSWWDQPRATRESALWKQVASGLTIPATVPAAERDNYFLALGREATLPAVYKTWGDAIKHANPSLVRSTMQWWHQDWTNADPDRVADDQDIVATQHMEEQYYHPVTIADQIEDWRRPDKPTYAYGNTDWQEDGTGGQSFRDIMTAFSRGVQGAGRNELPQSGTYLSEMGTRGPSPALKLLQQYGGISAHSRPEDQVAVWRSVYEMGLEGTRARPELQHFWNTSAAFNSCLYARRTAAIITDGKVRSGDLMKYKAVIISFEQPLPDDLLTPLLAFQRAGGIVLANKPSGGYWHPAGAIELGPVFRGSHACYDKNDDLDRWLDMQADEGTIGSNLIRAALAGRLQPLVDTDDKSTWLSVLRSGSTRYIVAVNLNLLPQPWQGLHRYAGYENTTYPVKPDLRISAAAVGPNPIIYDVLNGRRAFPKLIGPDWVVSADMSVFPGAILAVVPRAVAGIRLASGQSPDRAYVRVVARPVDSAGATIGGSIPLRITVDNAVGRTIYRLDRCTVGGIWDETLPVKAGASLGHWVVSVEELYAGHVATANLALRDPDYASSGHTLAWLEAPNPGRVASAMAGAKSIAVVVDVKKSPDLTVAATAASTALSTAGYTVSVISPDDYLADLKTYGWEGFMPSATYRPNLQLRPKKYDLILVLDKAGAPDPVVNRDTLPLRPTVDDPGPGHALIQFVAMPVYDTEDGIVITGGDGASVVAAVKGLRDIRAPSPAHSAAVVATVAHLTERESVETPPGMAEYLGVPISGVCSTPDGQRIAVTLKGWGNTLFVLNADGKILGSDLSGKFFPKDLAADATGFWVNTFDDDPTTSYRKHYDLDGNATIRIAANGRRIGGARDFSASHPSVSQRFDPQSSFSVSADSRLAAVGGSRGIALWNMASREVVWRDDTVSNTVPIGQKANVAPSANMFPQVSLSPDGTAIALQYNNVIYLRDGATGAIRGQQELPSGVSLGQVRAFDGHILVVGDNDFYAFRDARPLWHWKAPAEITSLAFNPDGEHYVIGEPGGALRILDGGAQVAGYLSDRGGIDCLALSSDGMKIAYATGGGEIGVLDREGNILWRDTSGQVPERISFLGAGDDVVAGDWRGNVSRFNATGRRLWTTDLTPHVFRPDTTARLTSPDPTDTLRVPPPAAALSSTLPGAERLITPQGIAYIHADGWHGGVDPPVGVIQGLINHQRISLAQPWFERDTTYGLAGAPAAPAVDITLPSAMSVDTVAVYEDASHPEAIPQDIKIEAWVNDNWKTVVHNMWVQDAVHVHQFAPIVTTKLRYTILGDLYHNVWTRAIDVYRSAAPQ